MKRIGPYEVLEKLGQGGMGVVYRVRAPDGKEAALKLLLRSDSGRFERFDRERRLLATLGEEDGFVGLLDAGATPEGRWLVMPLVPAGTLRQKLGKGPLGVEETATLGLELARALGKAHARGIVHRDVKPENVLFTASGKALLADLGLAKHFDPLAAGASQSVELTKDGSFRGTVGYSAPEQVENAKNAGPPADVFALGAILHECLAGRPAFEGQTLLELYGKINSGTRDPIGRSDVPPWLEEVIACALAPRPGGRFADGEELARALAAGTRGGEAGKSATRAVGPLRLAAAAMALGAVVVAVLLSTSSGAPAPPREQELTTLAQAKLASGDVEGALATARRAVELDPRSALAWAVRASARLRKNDSEGALADSEKAVSLDPTLALGWTNRAWAHSNLRVYDAAISDATKAISLDRKQARAWACRGTAHGIMKEWDNEIADETEAVALDPDYATAWANRAVARMRKRDIDGAIADLSRAAELEPRVDLHWANRGLAREAKGDHEGGRADLEHALDLNGPNRAAIAKLLEGVKRSASVSQDR